MAVGKCPVCSALHLVPCWGWELLLTEVGLFIWKARCWIDRLLDICVSEAGCVTLLTAHSCRPEESNSTAPTVCSRLLHLLFLASLFLFPPKKAIRRNDAIIQCTLLFSVYLISCQVIPCLCRSSAVDSLSSPCRLFSAFLANSSLKLVL